MQFVELIVLQRQRMIIVGPTLLKRGEGSALKKRGWVSYFCHKKGESLIFILTLSNIIFLRVFGVGVCVLFI